MAFGLNVDMAPLPVLFQGAALLVAATAVVALIGFFDCKQEFQLFTKATRRQHLTGNTFQKRFQAVNIRGCAGKRR